LTAPAAPAWPWWLFRVWSTTGAVLVFNQAVYAGQFLGGTYGALLTHRENATVAGIVLGAGALPGLLLWRAGRGPWWPALGCVALLALVALQINLGFARLLTVHVPLGVAIVLGAALLAGWAWRTPGPPPEPDDQARP
jgi:hypothetical protein